MDVVKYAIPIFLGLLALEIALNAFLKKSYYAKADSMANLGAGILSQLSGFISKPFLLYTYYLFFNFFTNSLTGVFESEFLLFNMIPGTFAKWAFAFLMVDLMYYWLHRHYHTVNLMWAFHVIHHSSEEYNLSVALRQSSFGFIIGFVYQIPIAVLGIPPEVFFTCYGVNLLYQFWIHTRLIPKMTSPLGRAFEFSMNTPSHHRVHHARQMKYLDKNYAGTFIIWDRMFGSFVEEDIEPKYGIYPRYQKFNPVMANVDPLLEIWKYFKIAPTFSLKMKVLFGSPLWLFETFKKGEVAKAIKFNGDASTSSFAVFGLSLVLTIVLLFFGKGLSAVSKTILALSITTMLYLVGKLCDEKLRASAKTQTSR